MEEAYINIIRENVQRVTKSNLLSLRDKVKGLFSLFSNVAEDLTVNERLVFTTLFSRLAYIGQRYKIDSSSLHLIHNFRRANEKLLFDNNHDKYIILGVHAIDVLLHYTLGEDRPVLDKDVESYFSIDKKKFVAFVPVIRGMIIQIDDIDYVVDFISEEDGTIITKVKFDVADKNEIFSENLKSIKKHLRLPITVNLIDVEVMEDDTLVPQGLVIMPDYLVDVTSVADCFKDYGTETMLSIISKFRSIEPTSIPILIGNVANMILDELVSDEDIHFRSLIPKIFEYNPVAMSLFSDEDIREIVAKSKLHYDNLKRVVKEEGPALGLDKSKMYLEPSFFSSDFGLQGRLDMFHHDRPTNRYDIVELKSGSPFKANIYGLSNNHYVQTLLYDLLIKSTYGKSIKPSSYILYSKLGSKSLKYAPTVKAQQYEAMKIRNELMIIDYISAYDIDKYKYLLEYISIDNFPSVKGFLQTDINSFNKLYKSVGQLLQNYFTEFISFIKREQFLSKTGVHGLNNSNGLAGIWLENTEEKEDRFALLKRLEIIKNESAEQSTSITLKHSSQTSELANFREGDIVVFYPFGERRDAVMKNQVFKCSISNRTSDQIRLKLRSKQHNHEIFRRYKYWNIEEDKLDSSFSRSYRSLYKFLGSNPKKIKKLLGIEMPLQPEQKQTPVYPRLTEEQRGLLNDMVSAKDYFLLWGPPGTGKTSLMVRSYVQYLYEETDQNILLLAYTNRAVDEICEAVVSIGAPYKINYLRVGSKTASGEPYRTRILENVIAGAKSRQDITKVLAPIRIFIGTISSMMNKPELFKLKKFNTAIVDEASQILEPNIIGLLTEVDKYILIGDHNQLPAVVQQSSDQSKIKSQDLIGLGITDMRMSLFERLYRQCLQKEWDHAYGILRQQGRMHEDLVKFPSVHFYKNQLTVLEGIERLTDKRWATTDDDLLKGRLLYIKSKVSEGLNYKTNISEAEKVVAILKRYKALKGKMTVGVITPYRAQIALIKKLCEDHEVDITEITVDTVERYQGGARDIIILSLCVNKIRQFRSLISLSSDGVDRKLNVALTRAKEQIIIIGNKELLIQNETYKALIEASTQIDI